MRAFLAVDPGETLRAALADLGREVPVGRPVAEENLHLTLAFLGDITGEEAEALHDGLAGRLLPGVRLRLAGLELWGGPAVLVIKAEREEGLMRVQEIVAGAARQAGVAPARRRFRPHVTLARFRKGLGPAAEARLRGFVAARGAVRLPEMGAERVVFLRSELHPDGVRYEEMAAYPLAG